MEWGEEMRMVCNYKKSEISWTIRISAPMSLTTGEKITNCGKTTAQEPAKGRITGTNQNITSGRKLIITDINWMPMCTEITAPHAATGTTDRNQKTCLLYNGAVKVMHASLLLHSYSFWSFLLSFEHMVFGFYIPVMNKISCRSETWMIFYWVVTVFAWPFSLWWAGGQKTTHMKLIFKWIKHAILK